MADGRDEARDFAWSAAEDVGVERGVVVEARVGNSAHAKTCGEGFKVVDVDGCEGDVFRLEIAGDLFELRVELTAWRTPIGAEFDDGDLVVCEEIAIFLFGLEFGNFDRFGEVVVVLVGNLRAVGRSGVGIALFTAAS